MSNMTINFLGKEYLIPEDVLAYLDLLKFTDSIKSVLMTTFNRKLSNSDIGCIEDKDMATEINQQVGKFISMLCDKGIYDRTVNDYLRNNKGYELFSQTNKAAFEKAKAILMDKLDTLKYGVEDALYKKDASVTGMGFSIWSGSFVNHAIYAAMQASTIRDQEKAANAQYQKDMDNLFAKMDSDEAKAKREYIYNVYIPNMDVALTMFAYELLDKYISDLIANNKFDKHALDFIDIARSNELLDNLTLSSNKSVILENAFTACPYNIAVYMQAMKYDLLDFDSFQTAKLFKQSDEILSFLKENWGEVSYPVKFSINYHSIDVLSLFTEKNPTLLLRSRTEQYATGIVKAYSRVADMLDNKELCRKLIREFDDISILAGDAISKGKAHSFVDSIVTPTIWNQLIDKCGQIDLLDRIKAFVPDNLQVDTKQDIDEYFINQLISNFEEARQNIILEINAKKEAEEKRRIEEEKQKAEQERIRQEKRAKRKVVFKKWAKISAFLIAGITTLTVLISLILVFVNSVIIPANRYNDAVALMDSGDWLKAKDILLSLDDYKDSEDLLEKCNNRLLDYQYDSAIQMINDKKYEEAISILEKLDGHKDSEELIEKCKIALLDIAYNDAAQLMKDGEFESAIASFEAIVDHKDSKEKIEECKNCIKEKLYSNAIALAKEGNYKRAVTILEELDNYKDSADLIKKYNFLGCEKGDEILLGSYEQDGDLSNGTEEIEWIVLDRKDNKALVVSKYCLENKPFNTTLTTVTWANSTIRKWLNGEFFQKTFASNEKSLILSSTIKNPDDEEQSRAGSNTVDKIFLLSSHEASIYFDTDSDRAAHATDYVSTNHCYWILRTPATNGPYVCHVDYTGELGYSENVDRKWWIRPAMWIEISE